MELQDQLMTFWKPSGRPSSWSPRCGRALLLADRVVMMTSAAGGDHRGDPVVRSRGRDGARRSSPRASNFEVRDAVVGFLEERAHAHPEGGWRKTLCPYCGVGCGLLVQIEGGAGSGASRAIPITRRAGRRLRQGVHLPPALSTPDRLLYPSRAHSPRRGALPRAVGAGRALRLRPPAGDRDRPRPGRGRLYGSGQLLTESTTSPPSSPRGSSHQQLRHELPTLHGVGRGRLRRSSDPTARRAPMRHRNADLLFPRRAPNTADCHPVTWSGYASEARRPRRRAVIVADPMDETADVADLHLPLRPARTSPAQTDAPRAVERRIAPIRLVALHTSGWNGTPDA